MVFFSHLFGNIRRAFALNLRFIADSLLNGRVSVVHAACVDQQLIVLEMAAICVQVSSWT